MVEKAQSVSILELGPKRVRISIERILSILDKVGSRPFVLYSINGGSRTGKSFMLNIFLQYLNNLGSRLSNDEWFKPGSLEGKFIWSGGAERVTEGINMWSEPFVARLQDGREICILLMDTQGNFDCKTSTHHNAIVFAFSALLSSVMIWNEMRDISGDILQFFQCFLGFAKMASEGLYTAAMENGENGTSFQRLVFLLRDFTFIRDFDFGLHDDTTGTAKNFKISRLHPNPHRAEEHNFMLSQILSNFMDVGIFALPHPGPRLSVYDDANSLDSNFAEYTKQFVELIFSPKILTTKRVGGMEITGDDFKLYVQKWTKQFLMSDLPEIKNIMGTLVEVQNSLAVRNAAEFYETAIGAVISNNPEGLEDAMFLKGHDEVMNRALNVFSKIRKLGDSETEAEYCAKLKITLAEKLTHYQQLNAINRKTGVERGILLAKKQYLEVVISSNEAKLERLYGLIKQGSSYLQAIENVTSEAEAIQKDLIAKTEAKLEETHKHAERERAQFQETIEAAKKRNEQLQLEIARQQQLATETRMRMTQRSVVVRNRRGQCILQ